MSLAYTCTALLKDPSIVIIIVLTHYNVVNTALVPAGMKGHHEAKETLTYMAFIKRKRNVV